MKFDLTLGSSTLVVIPSLTGPLDFAGKGVLNRD